MHVCSLVIDTTFQLKQIFDINPAREEVWKYSSIYTFGRARAFNPKKLLLRTPWPSPTSEKDSIIDRCQKPERNTSTCGDICLSIGDSIEKITINLIEFSRESSPESKTINVVANTSNHHLGFYCMESHRMNTTNGMLPSFTVARLCKLTACWKEIVLISLSTIIC